MGVSGEQDTVSSVHALVAAGDASKLDLVLSEAQHQGTLASVINAKTLLGDTPLHLAAVYGYIDVLRTLLVYKASVDAKDGQGATALHLACQQSNPELVRVLLEHRADVHVTDASGLTAFDHARAQARFGNSEPLEILCQHSAKRAANKAIYRWKNGHVREAATLFQEAFKMDPRNVHVALSYAMFIKRVYKRMDTATQILEYCRQLNPVPQHEGDVDRAIAMLSANAAGEQQLDNFRVAFRLPAILLGWSKTTRESHLLRRVYCSFVFVTLVVMFLNAGLYPYQSNVFGVPSLLERYTALAVWCTTFHKLPAWIKVQLTSTIRNPNGQRHRLTIIRFGWALYAAFAFQYVALSQSWGLTNSAFGYYAIVGNLLCIMVNVFIHVYYAFDSLATCELLQQLVEHNEPINERVRGYGMLLAGFHERWNKTSTLVIISNAATVIAYIGCFLLRQMDTFDIYVLCGVCTSWIVHVVGRERVCRFADLAFFHLNEESADMPETNMLLQSYADIRHRSTLSFMTRAVIGGFVILAALWGLLHPSASNAAPILAGSVMQPTMYFMAILGCVIAPSLVGDYMAQRRAERNDGKGRERGSSYSSADRSGTSSCASSTGTRRSLYNEDEDEYVLMDASPGRAYRPATSSRRSAAAAAAGALDEDAPFGKAKYQ